MQSHRSCSIIMDLPSTRLGGGRQAGGWRSTRKQLAVCGNGLLPVSILRGRSASAPSRHGLWYQHRFSESIPSLVPAALAVEIAAPVVLAA